MDKNSLAHTSWNCKYHMNMIWTCLGFNYFYTLSLAENSQYLPNLIF